MRAETDLTSRRQEKAKSAVIDQVMENSKELVKIEHTLKQIINIKGD